MHTELGSSSFVKFIHLVTQDNTELTGGSKEPHSSPSLSSTDRRISVQMQYEQEPANRPSLIGSQNRRNSSGTGKCIFLGDIELVRTAHHP